MSKMRVHELAKELDIKSSEIIEVLGEKGIDVKAQSSIDEASIEIVKKKFHSAKSENKKEEKENKTMVKVTVNVEGMMCGHCEAHVNKAIQAAFGAEDVVSSHENGKTVFTVPEKVDEAKVEEVIKEAGYEFKGITQE